MDDRSIQTPQGEDNVRTNAIPITPRRHQVHVAGPAAVFAQFRTMNSNKGQGLHASPVKVRHGRSKSLTEGGAKSDFFMHDTRNNNNNSPLDSDAAPPLDQPLEQRTLAVTPDALTPSTSPRGMVVRVPPNTPARSPGQELRSRLTDLEQETRDWSDKCDTLKRENERLTAELMSRSDFSKTEAEQFVQTFEEMTNKLTVKEEDLRVLKIELDQKSKQLTELTNELEPYTTVTDLKTRVTELETNSKELDSALEKARSELDFVQHDLQAANDTATDLAKQLEDRDTAAAGLHAQVTNLEAEIERWKLVAQEIGTAQEENESLQKQLQTQRERAEQLERERESAHNEHVTETETLRSQVTALDGQLTQLREELARTERALKSAESAVQTARTEGATQQHEGHEQHRALQQSYETLLREVNELRMGTADLEELRKEVTRKDELLTRVKSKSAALEEEKLKLHDQLKISEVTVERLTEQLKSGDKSGKQRVTQLEQELKHVTGERDRVVQERDRASEELTAHKSRVTALTEELQRVQARDQQLHSQLQHEQSSAAKLNEELKRVTSEHHKCAHSATELTKARDSFREAAKKLEQQLDSAQKSATTAAEKYKSEITSLREELQRTGTSLKRYESEVSQLQASFVPPHTDMIAALKTRSHDMKQHVTKLQTKSVASSALSLTTVLATVLLIALALVLGLAVVSRDQLRKVVLYAQQYLPK
eukprot:TRINITY_DN7759_c0_g1_i1.p1 TRINITY_DN7759_c0_g1~~TRINITY_DN7759_c0_g1_i1.p1  ORF type:complete len:715 (+),score=325.30 TRINITY_DN7759_c0_g1_i1:56-2200(+)